MEEKSTSPKNVYLEKMMLKDAFVHIRVNRLIHTKVMLKAKRDGVSVSQYIRRLIEQQCK